MRTTQRTEKAHQRSRYRRRREPRQRRHPSASKYQERCCKFRSNRKTVSKNEQSSERDKEWKITVIKERYLNHCKTEPELGQD
jgi:hypothetical protein